MSLNIVVTAGGTGGHVFPAIAVAKRFEEKGYVVHWLGTSAGIESQVVPESGIELHLIDMKGLRERVSDSVAGTFSCSACLIAVDAGDADTEASRGFGLRWLCGWASWLGGVAVAGAFGDP